jgi:hypothetical protein
VFGYGWDFYIKKIGHATLCQPNGFVLEYGVYFNCAIFGFVEDDF